MWWIDLSQVQWAFSCRNQFPHPLIHLRAPTPALSHNARPEMFRHCACHFGAHRSVILQIWKYTITQESYTFSDFQYSTCRCSELACKVTWPVSLRHSHTDSHGPWPENVETLCINSEHLEVEYCPSEKSVRIMRSSGIWHFFRFAIFYF
jgi:hypothetical protein